MNCLEHKYDGLSGDNVIYLSLRDKHAALITQVSSIPISARTDVYKYSFFPRTLLDRNTLSQLNSSLLKKSVSTLKYSLSASESADLVD